jgi:hypothetical protein
MHDDTAGEVARAIDVAEKRVRAAVPMARHIYLEPDLDRSGGLPESLPSESGGHA